MGEEYALSNEKGRRKKKKKKEPIHSKRFKLRGR